MMKPKFQIKNDRIFCNEKWISNGHWIVDRAIARTVKEMRVVAGLTSGRYDSGFLTDPVAKCPPMDHLVPKLDETFRRLESTPKRVTFSDDAVMSYVFETVGVNTFEIAVNPNYMRILRLGKMYAKDRLGPILVCGDDNEPYAALMPMRM